MAVDLPYALRVSGVVFLLLGASLGAVKVLPLGKYLGACYMDGTYVGSGGRLQRNLNDTSVLEAAVIATPPSGSYLGLWRCPPDEEEGGWIYVVCNPRGGTIYTYKVTFVKTGEDFLAWIIVLPDGGYSDYKYWYVDVKSPTPSYNVTIETTSGGSTDPAPGTYTKNAGESMTVTAKPSSGYKFTGWTVDGTAKTENPLTVTVNSNMSIKANFTPIQQSYTLSVSVSPSGAGTVSGAGAYLSGTTVTLTATPVDPSKYYFAYWSGDASGTSPTVSVYMDRNKSVTANFAQYQAPAGDFYINDQKVSQDSKIIVRTRALSFKFVGTQNTSYITGVKVEVVAPDGTTKALDLAKKDGWWEGSYTAAADGAYKITCKVSYPAGTVTAASLGMTFGSIPVPPGKVALYLQCIPPEGGAVRVVDPPDQVVVDNGAAVTVQAFPNRGWRFAGWVGYAENSERLTFVATEDTNVAAMFEREVGPLGELLLLLKAHLATVLIALGAVQLAASEVVRRRRGT